MYCKKCGAQIPDGNNFCQNCGTPTAAVNESAERNYINTPQNQTAATVRYPQNTAVTVKKKNETVKIVIPILICILLFGSFFTYLFTTSNRITSYSQDEMIEKIQGEYITDNDNYDELEIYENGELIRFNYTFCKVEKISNLNGRIYYFYDNGYEFYLQFNKNGTVFDSRTNDIYESR